MPLSLALYPWPFGSSAKLEAELAPVTSTMPAAFSAPAPEFVFLIWISVLPVLPTPSSSSSACEPGPPRKASSTA